jgi:hypothetical protein
MEMRNSASGDLISVFGSPAAPGAGGAGAFELTPAAFARGTPQAALPGSTITQEKTAEITTEREARLEDFQGELERRVERGAVKGQRVAEAVEGLTGKKLGQPAPRSREEILQGELDRENQRLGNQIVPGAGTAVPAGRIGAVETEVLKLNGISDAGIAKLEEILDGITDGVAGISELPGQARKLFNDYTAAQRQTAYRVRKDLTPAQKEFLSRLGPDAAQNAAARMTELASTPPEEMDMAQLAYSPGAQSAIEIRSRLVATEKVAQELGMGWAATGINQQNANTAQGHLKVAAIEATLREVGLRLARTVEEQPDLGPMMSLLGNSLTVLSGFSKDAADLAKGDTNKYLDIMKNFKSDSGYSAAEATANAIMGVIGIGQIQKYVEMYGPEFPGLRALLFPQRAEEGSRIVPLGEAAPSEEVTPGEAAVNSKYDDLLMNPMDPR